MRGQKKFIIVIKRVKQNITFMMYKIKTCSVEVKGILFQTIFFKRALCYVAYKTGPASYYQQTKNKIKYLPIYIDLTVGIIFQPLKFKRIDIRI